jgi:hypothetical protein
MPHARAPRFNRVANARNIQLTSKDFYIIEKVFRYRLLTSRQIAVLARGSPQNLLRRLKLLYHKGFLDRPIAQLDYYRAGGSHPIVYALGNRGADLLPTKLGIPRHEIDWTAKNRSMKRVFLQHTLAVSDVLVRTESACRDSGLQFIGKEEALTELTRASTNYGKLRWNVSVPFEGSQAQVGVIPDSLFGVRRRSDAEAVYFFLEVDRGTMPVIRKDLQQTSLYRKLLAYYETWRQGLHTSLFGLKRFRVLIFAASRERVSHLKYMNKLLNDGKGSRIFLFADSAGSAFWEDILALPLVNGRDELMTSLLEESRTSSGLPEGAEGSS